MGRYLFPILFAVVLVGPFALRLAVGGEADEAGEGDAEARLVVVSPHNRDILAEFERLWRLWSRDRFGYEVDLDYRNVGGSNDIVKAFADFYGQADEDVAGAPYHVVWGGGDYAFDREMEPLNALQAIELPSDLMAAAYPSPDLAGIALYDQDDDGTHWYGVCLSSFGIVYNPDLYDRLGLPPPQTWSDLARPELHDLLVLADPGKSGSAAVAYVMALQRAMADAEEAYFAAGGTADDAGYEAALDEGWRRGMGDLLLIAANARYFTDSASEVPSDVSHANAAAGTAIDFYGRVEEETVGRDRIRFVAPKAATAVTPDPVAVCRGTTGDDLKHATAFVEFLLTPQAQTLWNKRPGVEGGPRDRALRRTPVRPDVFADQSGWTDLQNPFEEAGGFNQRGAWMAEFGETRAVWQAAWIDAGAALDAAYAAVLAVPDEGRRAALLADLRDLPVEWDGESGWAGVKALRADRKSREDAAQALFLNEAKSALAARFREHYRAVGRAARGG